MKTLAFLLTNILFISFLISCKSEKQNEPVDDEYTRIDNGLIGVIRPPRSVEVPDLLDIIKEVNSSVIYMIKADSASSNSQLITVSKYVGDTIMPMEIVFIEKTVKHTGELYGCESKLVDFGVFDKGNKRFRYKIVRTDKDCFKAAFKDSEPSNKQQDTSSLSPPSDIFRIMYYFMKNDSDSVMYELAITSRESSFTISEATLTKMAESFRFFE